MNFKKIFQEKRYGFYVTLSLIALTLITAITYVACYGNNPRDFSLTACILLFVGFAISLVFVLLNKVKILPYILSLFILASLLFYVEAIYLYVSEVMVGIDKEMTGEFLVTTIFYVLTFVVAIVDLFLPQTKRAEGVEKPKMNVRVLNNVAKGLMASGTALFGFILVGSNIATANRTAISNELGQPLFKIEGKDKDAKYYKSDYTKIEDLMNDGKDLVEEIESEGIVLLENNNNALPLAKDSKVSLFGHASANPSFGGRGSSRSRNTATQVNFKQALEGEGFKVNQKLYDYYDSYKKYDSEYREYFIKDYDIPYEPSDKFPTIKTISESDDLKNSIAEYGDAAIYILTRTSGEATDIKLDKKRNALELSDEEKGIIRNLCALKEAGKVNKVIVVFNSTNQIEQRAFEEFDIDAALWIGHPGITGFKAVAKVLDGTVNPSGRLPDTFWYEHKDNPVMKNFGTFPYTNKDAYSSKLPQDLDWKQCAQYVAYQEGVYLGYRYAETRYTDVMNKVQNAGEWNYDDIIYRPFGYGESYTTFETSNFKAVKGEGEYTVTLDVKNTGGVAGKYVAQVYVQKPFTEYDITNHIEKPAVELVGFEKTKLLEPNESQTLTIKVDEKDFTTYDKNKAKTYILEDGKYLLTAADNSHEAAKNFLQYFDVEAGGNKNFVAGFDYTFDAEKYSTSRATGNKITNVFDKSDINLFEGHGDNKLEFLSRTNWTKELSNELKLTDEMVAELNRQQSSSSIQKQEGEYPTYGAENNLQLINLLKDEAGNKIPYDDPKWDKFLDQLTYEETVELISNGLRLTTASLKVGKPATRDHNGPCGITEPYLRGDGLAKEAGVTDQTLTAPNYPSIPVIAATFNKDLATKFGHMLGEDALWAGYNALYGIGLNTHRSPYEGRHFEYWSEDPLLAGLMSANEVKALQAKGCNAYIKHFALNDQESQRFGINVWSNEQALREISLRPFEHAVVEGGAMNAMAAFSRIGLEYAPASKGLMTDFLRGELGMKGLVVTDMFTLGYNESQMPYFLMAGCDLPDGEIKHSVYGKFKTGYPQVAQQMREAAKRICYSTVTSNAMNGFTNDTVVVPLTPAWEQALNTGKICLITYFALSCAASAFIVVWNNRKRFSKVHAE